MLQHIAAAWPASTRRSCEPVTVAFGKPSVTAKQQDLSVQSVSLMHSSSRGGAQESGNRWPACDTPSPSLHYQARVHQGRVAPGHRAGPTTTLDVRPVESQRRVWRLVEPVGQSQSAHPPTAAWRRPLCCSPTLTRTGPGCPNMRRVAIGFSGPCGPGHPPSTCQGRQEGGSRGYATFECSGQWG